jgi:hypothetical protein
MSAYVPPPFQIPQKLLDDLKKLGPLLDVGTEAVSFGRETIIRYVAGKPLNSDFQVVVRVIFTKGFQTFMAVQNLCRCGCGSDALSLCASLFENYIDLRYIEKAPVVRSRRYIQYEQVEKYYQAQKVLARKRLPKGMRKQFRGYESKLGPQVAKLLKYFPKSSKGWSQRSLYDRAKAIRSDLEYNNLYWIFCGHKHTLPMAVSGFVSGKGNEMDLILGPDIKGVFEAARWSTHYFIGLCDFLQYAYKMSLQSDIQVIGKKFSNAAEQVLKRHPELCE